MESKELVAQKTVVVFSTLGKNAQEIKTNVTTWGELQKELSKAGVTYSGMKAVIGETKNTLESANAVLPAEGFTLYLMPIKTKSGADRKELMTTIKEFVTANPNQKSNFIIDGKNMTQLSTATLETLVSKHIAGGMKGSSSTASASKSAPEKKVKEEPVVDYDALITAKKAEVDAAVKSGNYAALGNLGIEVAKLEADKAEALKKAEIAKAEARKAEAEAEAKAKKTQESGADEVKRLEKERKEKLNTKLAKEAAELMGDFNDVKRY